MSSFNWQWLWGEQCSLSIVEYLRLVIEHRIHGDRLDLNMIQQYIHAHIADKIQVSELAQLCDLSASHFYQKFRDKTGVSPHQYLILERIKVARFLLGNTVI